MQNPAGVEEAVAWLGVVRLLGIRFSVSGFYILFSPYPSLFCFFALILSPEGEKKPKPKQNSA